VSGRPIALAACVLALALAGGCEREQRQLRSPPSGNAATSSVRLSPLQPGQGSPAPAVNNAYEENAYAVSQGKRWFRWYNCNGCHASGGGGMGPALMDDKWIYGAEPANIFATIVQGRPNGMPAFGGRIPDDQVWQLVAYVRSMSGQLRSDVAPGRNDGMQTGEPESRREPEPPKPVSEPKPG
jgi:cytochrome c oxidase cbb3-type subunit III